ncbi:MAG: hypothetical protein Q8P11_00200 [bacterium]|nr:hypothetical protein [bacterium]
MKKQSKSTIKIAEVIASVVSSRDIVDSLEAIIKKTHATTVELDFCDVVFVSRSAAHEFLLLQKKLSQTVLFVNTNEDVTTMLRVVAANRAVPKNVDQTLRFERISADALFI